MSRQESGKWFPQCNEENKRHSSETRARIEHPQRRLSESRWFDKWLKIQLKQKWKPKRNINMFLQEWVKYEKKPSNVNGWQGCVMTLTYDAGWRTNGWEHSQKLLSSIYLNLYITLSQEFYFWAFTQEKWAKDLTKDTRIFTISFPIALNWKRFKYPHQHQAGDTNYDIFI